MSKLDPREKDRLRVITAYQEVFLSGAGKVVLEDLAKASGFLADEMDPNPHVMAYNVGARQLYARILATIGEDLHATIKRFEQANLEEEGD